MKGVDMFNFQGVMSDYYGHKPKDDAGIAGKRTFQANMIQSAMDTQLAMMQAEQAQKYDLDTRLATADLELSNQKALMKDTFDYGMQKMASEYDYQSRFAVDQASRDLNQMAAAGDIQQNQTQLEGKENRLTLDQQGRQDIQKIGAQGGVDVQKISATGKEERAGIQTKGQEERKGLETQGGIDLEKIGATGEQERLTVGAKGEQDRLGMQTKGEEDRKTMSAATRETAKDRANQRQFSRELAAR